MNVPTYKVVRGSGGGYAVEIHVADGMVVLRDGFASEEAAQEWSIEQMLMTADSWNRTNIGHMHRDD